MGDTLYVGSCSGEFLALNRATGEVAWSYDTSVDASGAQFHGDAVVIDEVIVVGSDSVHRAYVYAFDRGTGAVRWKRGFSGGVATTPLRHDERVYVMTGSGDVVAVERDSGEIDWSVSGASLGGEGRIRSKPAMVGERLYVAWPSGQIAAIDHATGGVVWTAKLGTPVNTSLAVVGDAVVAGTIDGRLHSVDLASGKVMAQLHLDGILYGDLIATDTCIYVLSGETNTGSATEKHTINCIEPSLEKSSWSQQISEEWSTFHPLLHGDGIIAGYASKLVAYDRRTGAKRWTCAIGGTPRGLTSVGDQLYVGTLRGRVLAVPIADCVDNES